MTTIKRKYDIVCAVCSGPMGQSEIPPGDHFVSFELDEGRGRGTEVRSIAPLCDGCGDYYFKVGDEAPFKLKPSKVAEMRSVLSRLAIRDARRRRTALRGQQTRAASRRAGGARR